MKNRAFAFVTFLALSLAGRASAQEYYTYTSWTLSSNFMVYWDNPADSTLIIDQVLSVSTLSSSLTRATVRSTAGVYATVNFTTANTYGWTWNRPQPLSADGIRVITEALRGYQRDRASFRPITCSHLYRYFSGSTGYTATPLSEFRIDVASPVPIPDSYGIDECGTLTSMYLWDHADLWTSVTIRRIDGTLMNLHLVRSENAISTRLSPMTADRAIQFNRDILIPSHWVYVSNGFRPYSAVRYLHSGSRWVNN